MAGLALITYAAIQQLQQPVYNVLLTPLIGKGCLYPRGRIMLIIMLINTFLMRSRFSSLYRAKVKIEMILLI